MDSQVFWHYWVFDAWSSRSMIINRYFIWPHSISTSSVHYKNLLQWISPRISLWSGIYLAPRYKLLQPNIPYFASWYCIFSTIFLLLLYLPKWVLKRIVIFLLSLLFEINLIVLIRRIPLNYCRHGSYFNLDAHPIMQLLA